jgi:hypothetical protein
MEEGADIVKKALEKYNTEKIAGNGRLSVSSEPNRVALVQEMLEKGRNFQAGRSPMSADQRRAISERLRNKNRQLHATL